MVKQLKIFDFSIPKGKAKVQFLRNFPSFIGYPDLKKYGPYAKGSVAYIPKRNAEVLEKRGVVKVLTRNPFD